MGASYSAKRQYKIISSIAYVVMLVFEVWVVSEKYSVMSKGILQDDTTRCVYTDHEAITKKSMVFYWIY